MSWIKRNLLFVIGASVALLLMVGAGFYTWTGWSHNAKSLEDLNQKYEVLKGLNNQPVRAGSDKVDNIKAAREQKLAVQKVWTEAAKQFESIPAIPEGTNITAEMFANSLSRTIASLQREATNSGVTLSPKYAFSFQQQSTLMKFAPGSVAPLSVQLGEVKAVSQVLIAAKVNALDSIQRERVSADDQAGQQTDYLDSKSETNELAVLTPYQVTFRSFTPELAHVLSGFSSSPHGIIVKSLNVEPAPVAVVEVAATPLPVYQPVAPVSPTPTTQRDAFMERYGIRGGKGGVPPPTPSYTPPPTAAPAAPVVPSAPRTVLNEKQLKVTMLLQVVKLQPKK